jgi:glutamate dehydrogenase
LNGGKINTDAIDNSAGVDTSDHEVNIKIALNPLMAAGKLPREERDRLLVSMTDEVAALVLRDNYLQTQAISITELRSAELLDRHARMIRFLEKKGKLDRRIEFLPDEEELRQRAGQRKGLVRPSSPCCSPTPRSPSTRTCSPPTCPTTRSSPRTCLRYFPGPMVEGVRGAIDSHRLRREIIATYVTNSTVNRVGPSFVSRMMETTGRSAPDVARAYTISRDAFEMRQVWAGIEALDNRCRRCCSSRSSGGAAAHRARHALVPCSAGTRPLEVSSVVATFRPALRALAADLDVMLASERREGRRQAHRRVGPERRLAGPLAQRVAAMRELLAGTDVVRLALAVEAPPEAVAKVYFGVGERLGLDWLRTAAERVKIEVAVGNGPAVEGIVDDLSLAPGGDHLAGARRGGAKAEWREGVAPGRRGTPARWRGWTSCSRSCTRGGDRPRHADGGRPAAAGALGSVTIYQLKPAFQRLLRPLVARLVGAGVTPNAVTVAALLLSIAVGAFIALLRTPAALLLLPPTLLVRMALNALDGMMAREHGLQSALGGLLNEVGDVVADAALYLPLALVPPFVAPPIVLAVVLAAASELAGVAAVAVAPAAGTTAAGEERPRLRLRALALLLGLRRAPATAR